MGCKHKFFGIEDYDGLIPKWYFDKLIIGTFNPSNLFHETNTAQFFYQRKKNYFWDVMPLLFNANGINKENTSLQKEFLIKNRIGITDILTCIVDADKNVEEHKRLISTVKDDDIEVFKCFEWNTLNIIDVIRRNSISEVYFTKLGVKEHQNILVDTFEYQIKLIEEYCEKEGIYNRRLHSPTGMGLGKGKRIETLYKRWIRNGFVKH